MPYLNVKGADKDACLFCLICGTFIVASVREFITSRVYSQNVQASLAEQTSLSLNWLITARTGFLMTRLCRAR